MKTEDTRLPTLYTTRRKGAFCARCYIALPTAEWHAPGMQIETLLTEPLTRYSLRKYMTKTERKGCAKCARKWTLNR